MRNQYVGCLDAPEDREAGSMAESVRPDRRNCGEMFLLVYGGIERFLSYLGLDRVRSNCLSQFKAVLVSSSSNAKA
jgi:hypothetical protein